MPTLSPHHICYTQLDAVTWCATAPLLTPLSQLLPCLWSEFSKPLALFIPLSYPIELNCLSWQICMVNNPLSVHELARIKRQQQRNGVRLLLKTLLHKLAIMDTLDESKFPYRLVNSGYYVCFSHSGNGYLNNSVAVVISRRRAVGIDIETQDIAWRVAQRFYHPLETTILAALPVSQRMVIAKWLWQFKESFIKIHQYKLAQGLGMDYVPIVLALIDALNEDDSSLILISDNQSDYQIAILPYQQTVVIF